MTVLSPRALELTHQLKDELHHFDQIMELFEHNVSLSKGDYTLYKSLLKESRDIMGIKTNLLITILETHSEEILDIVIAEREGSANNVR